MQKTIRRQDRALSQADAEIILTEGIYGVLSTISADQTPYGMPMTYIYDHGSLYFHGATAGHRMENLLQNPNACFTVVAQNQQIPVLLQPITALPLPLELLQLFPMK